MPMSERVFSILKKVGDEVGLPAWVWYPIAMHESEGDPKAVGDNGNSIGIFQVNTSTNSYPEARSLDLEDPEVNARFMMPKLYIVYKQYMKVNRNRFDIVVDVEHYGERPLWNAETAPIIKKRLLTYYNEFVNGKEQHYTSFVDNESIIVSAPKNSASFSQIRSSYGEDVELKDHVLDFSPGYLIFFDNVRVDQYVKNFSTNLSCNGTVTNATIEMIYVPDFYKVKTIDRSTGYIEDVQQGIENMTNVKIFIKNVFNDKYVMVFDGNIRGKSLVKSSGGSSTISFNAMGYMNWLMRTMAPLVVPQNDQFYPGERLKWYAHGVDIDSVSSIARNVQFSFILKTLEEYVQFIVSKTLSGNALFSDPASVSVWDAATERIIYKPTGDIDSNLIQAGILDYTPTTSATAADSVYDTINTAAKYLLFEFFQDRDGIIRIKHPYWNDPVLKDHIIEPLMIINYNENIDYNSNFTRVVVTGGLDKVISSGLSDAEAKYLTPSGAYVGNFSNQNGAIWVDFLSGAISNFGNEVITEDQSSDANKLTVRAEKPSEYQNFYEWDTSLTWGELYKGSLHLGLDFKASINTPVYHTGPKGIYRRHEMSGGFGKYVTVELVEGGDNFRGCIVIYGHLNKFESTYSGSQTLIQDGSIISDGDLIGYTGSTGNSTGVHLHFEVDKPGSGYRGVSNIDDTVDPMLYINTYKNSASTNNGYSYNFIGPIDTTLHPRSSLNSDEKTILVSPSEDEKKYGANVYNASQPLIKYPSDPNDRSESKNTQYSIALRRYADSLYHIINSSAEVCSVTVNAMPWLRPGFNVWVDPISIDKVYYLQSITHYGSMDGGVFSQLSLSLGRERKHYTEGRGFGSLKKQSDNLFIQNINTTTDDFGDTVSKEEYDVIRSKILSFYKSSDTKILKANQSEYFKYFYGVTNSDNSYTTISNANVSYNSSDVTKNTVTKNFGVNGRYSNVGRMENRGNAADLSIRHIFSGEYTLSEIQSNLNDTYSNAPQVVVERVSKIKTIMNNAKSYISKNYSSEF